MFSSCCRCCSCFFFFSQRFRLCFCGTSNRGIGAGLPVRTYTYVTSGKELQVYLRWRGSQYSQNTNRTIKILSNRPSNVEHENHKDQTIPKKLSEQCKNQAGDTGRGGTEQPLPQCIANPQGQDTAEILEEQTKSPRCPMKFLLWCSGWCWRRTHPQYSFRPSKHTNPFYMYLLLPPKTTS